MKDRVEAIFQRASIFCISFSESPMKISSLAVILNKLENKARRKA